MLASLAGRMSHAFYPNLQRLYVEGNLQRFKTKFPAVLGFSAAVGTGAAGLVIAGNRTLIEFLTGGGFYAGVWTNAWLAVAVAIAPLTTSSMNLLQYSGSMGKAGLFSLMGVCISMGAGVLGYLTCEIPGLAAAFALAPALALIPYGLSRGARNVGIGVGEAAGAALIWSVFSIGAILGAAALIAGNDGTHVSMNFFGRALMLPTLREALLGGLLAVAGLVKAVQMLPKIKAA